MTTTHDDGLPSEFDAVLDPRRLRAFLESRHRVPASTYRLQFHGDFSFRDAAELVPYLAGLGVDACYCSPYLQARPDTQHGYDICDHNRLHAELGSEGDYDAFIRALAAHGLGQVLDFVPNHMGVDPVANRWWRDVLENGPASPYSRFFDIDWDPVKVELKGRVLLPVLEEQYGIVLERGDLHLAWKEDRLVLKHGALDFPIDPKECPRFLKHRLESLEQALGSESSDFREFCEVIEAFGELPDREQPHLAEERGVAKERAWRRLAALKSASPEISRHLEDNRVEFNGSPGSSESFDLLHELLEVQPYRLSYWKTAHDEINYRRFFQINDLGGIRMEDPEVFRATHGLVLRLIRAGHVTALRLDHIDGLRDPYGYLERLQEAVLLEWASECFGGGPHSERDLREAVRLWRDEEKKADPGGLADRPLYLIVEKILSPAESLPSKWPLHGTTGYDFLNELNRLFVDPRQGTRMSGVYEDFTGGAPCFKEVVYECKKLITRISMAGELKMLARELNRLSEMDRRTRDFTLDSLREAVRETVCRFPVYRTYVDASGIGSFDRRVIEEAVGLADKDNPIMEPGLFRYLRRLLLGEDRNAPVERLRRRLEFVMRFQQYTGPVQAKGLEDTAFYRHNPLASLNEVGGEPDRFGAEPREFHDANLRRLRDWPFSMLATSTHDTKRGEDVRARLNVLSEIPEEWREQVVRWRGLHSGYRTWKEGTTSPDAGDEYLFYQTLVGAWPMQAEQKKETVPASFVQRVRDYMIKAVREARRRSSWQLPNERYEDAVVHFVERVLDGPATRWFLQDFHPFQRKIARLGMLNSLSQVLLKIVSPGVPDFYQGSELWDLNLVDPDNRRPVDYERRRRMLEELEPLLPDSKRESADPGFEVGDLLERWHDGRIKLLVTACGLHLRRACPELFLRGEYHPLKASGVGADHSVAVARFDRRGRRLVAIAPRLPAGLVGKHEGRFPLGSKTWGESELSLSSAFPEEPLRNVFTREILKPVPRQGRLILRLSEVLGNLPVALLFAPADS